MVNDPIGDLIARLKNAAMRGRATVTTPASRMRAAGYFRIAASRTAPGRLSGGIALSQLSIVLMLMLCVVFALRPVAL